MSKQKPHTIDSPLSHGKAVRAGRAAKARAGIPTGPVPLGYRKIRVNGAIVINVDEEVAPLVQEAFRLAGLKRQSLRKILEPLSDSGLASRHGRPLSPTALWRILTNDFYCGIVRCGSETADGAHSPLVSRSEFDRIQTSINGRRKN